MKMFLCSRWPVEFIFTAGNTRQQVNGLAGIGDEGDHVVSHIPVVDVDLPQSRVSVGAVNHDLHRVDVVVSLLTLQIKQASAKSGSNAFCV